MEALSRHRTIGLSSNYCIIDIIELLCECSQSAHCQRQPVPCQSTLLISLNIGYAHPLRGTINFTNSKRVDHLSGYLQSNAPPYIIQKTLQLDLFFCHGISRYQALPDMLNWNYEAYLFLSHYIIVGQMKLMFFPPKS